MESREIAEKARNLAVMVRVQGPDPRGLKMRGSAFHQRENGITALSASGLLLPPCLSDSLTLLSGKRHMGALVMTTASVVEPFLPAQYRNLGYKNSTAIQAAVPELIPGACIDVLHEQNKSVHGPGEPRESPCWHQAQLLAIVDVGVSSAALQLLIGSHRASTDHSSWEVGWMLASLDSSPELDSFQREFKGAGNKSRSGTPLDFGLDASTSMLQMAMSTTKIVFLEISSVDPKDLLNVKISYQQRRGDVLLALGSPFGVLSPLHFLNSVSVGAVANSCPSDSYDSSLLVADVRCLPGMEGGPVFDRYACLVGILTRPVRQKNCSAEIQLVITWNAISTTCNLQEHKANGDGNEKLQEAPAFSAPDFQMPLHHTFKHNASDSFESPLEKVVSSIVLVTVGDEAWASGILLNKDGLILTNAHLLEPWRFGRSSLLNSANEPMVLSVSANESARLDGMIPPESQCRNPDTVNSFSGPGYKTHKRMCVRLNHTEPWIWSDAKVVYISKGPLDIALLQLDFFPYPLRAINPDFLCPSAGSKVHVIGHGPFAPRSDIGPHVSCGVVTKVVRSRLSSSLQQRRLDSAEECSPVMLQTTAAVYPGMSGGAVVSLDGRMIGLVTSNVRHAGGTTIPHMNFSLPCAALKPIFNFAAVQPDTSVLEILDKPNAFLSSVWALVPPPLPSPRPQAQLDMKNKEGKGSRFAKFLAERRAEVLLSSDLKPVIKGRVSSNLLISKL